MLADDGAFFRELVEPWVEGQGEGGGSDDSLNKRAPGYVSLEFH